MLRKTMIALFAVASVAMLAPEAASARGGGGGSYHSAGIGGGSFRSAAVGSGSFRSAAIGAPAFHSFNGGASHHRFHGRRFAFAAFAGPYAYYDDYYPYDYYGDGGCYIARQRVHTRYGWRIRPVQVCG